MSSELLVDYGEDAATAQLGQLKLSTIEDQQWPPDESTLSKSGETMFSNYRLKEPSSVLQETFRIFLLELPKLHTQKHTPALFFLWYIFVAPPSETDLSQPFDAGSPHLPWDHPFYDIARHQIIEVAGLSVSTLIPVYFFCNH